MVGEKKNVLKSQLDIGATQDITGLVQLRRAGFSTGSAPRAGAIGVKPGHVVYVESVSGSNVNISEMGWGYRANTVPNYRTVSASEFTYIY